MWGKVCACVAGDAEEEARESTSNTREENHSKFSKTGKRHRGLYCSKNTMNPGYYNNNKKEKPTPRPNSKIAGKMEMKGEKRYDILKEATIIDR